MDRRTFLARLGRFAALEPVPALAANGETRVRTTSNGPPRKVIVGTPIHCFCSRALRSLTAALLITLLQLVVASHTFAQDSKPRPLRVGMIGLDTSHVP